MIDFPWAPWQWRGPLGFPGKGCWREAAAGVRRDNAEALLTLTQALRALEHRSFTLIYKQQLAFRLPHSLFARKYVFYCWLFFLLPFFWMGVCVYLHGWCCALEAVLVHVCMMHVEARDWCWKSYVVPFYLFWWSMVSQWNSKSTHPTGLSSLGIPCLCLPRLGAEDKNTSPHTCMASSFNDWAISSAPLLVFSPFLILFLASKRMSDTL